jgi:hypothetical protein
MTTTTLLISIAVIIVLAILIRAFWFELFVVYQVLRGIFYLGALSLISALIWCTGVLGTQEELTKFWILFFVIYSAMTLVFVGIILDIFRWSVDFIRSLFR